MSRQHFEVLPTVLSSVFCPDVAADSLRRIIFGLVSPTSKVPPRSITLDRNGHLCSSCLCASTKPLAAKLSRWINREKICVLDFGVDLKYKRLLMAVRVTCSICWKWHTSCHDRVWLFLEVKMWSFYWIRLWTEIHLPLLLAEKQRIPAKVYNESAHLTSARYEERGHKFVQLRVPGGARRRAVYSWVWWSSTSSSSLHIQICT